MQRSTLGPVDQEMGPHVPQHTDLTQARLCNSGNLSIGDSHSLPSSPHRDGRVSRHLGNQAEAARLRQ